jgi:transcription elongation factor GreA
MLPKTTTVLTPEGKAKLEAELEYLVTVRRREVAERIHQAMEFSGDPVDNAEYQDAKDEQAFVEGRIREIERILATATVMATESQEAGVVHVGCVVTVRDENGENETFTIVGSTEADPFEGRYSVDSPVCRALLGHAVGDTVSVAVPDGEMKYTILAIKCRPRA